MCFLIMGPGMSGQDVRLARLVHEYIRNTTVRLKHMQSTWDGNGAIDIQIADNTTESPSVNLINPDGEVIEESAVKTILSNNTQAELPNAHHLASRDIVEQEDQPLEEPQNVKRRSIDS
jgi:hypothetical protein